MKWWRRQWPWITIAVTLLVSAYIWAKVMHFTSNADHLLALVSAAASIVAAVFAAHASISQATSPDVVIEFADPPVDKNNVVLPLNVSGAVLLPVLIRNEGSATADRCYIELRFPTGIAVETRATMWQPPGGLMREQGPNLIPLPWRSNNHFGLDQFRYVARLPDQPGRTEQVWIYPGGYDTVEIRWTVQSSRSTRQGSTTVHVKRPTAGLPVETASVS